MTSVLLFPGLAAAVMCGVRGRVLWCDVTCAMCCLCRPRERRVPFPLEARLYRRSRSFCLHLGDTSCKDSQFIGALQDGRRFSPNSSPGK